MAVSGITVGTLLSVHARAIEERLSRDVQYHVMRINPVWRDLLRSSIGVDRNPRAMGRDLAIIKTYTGSLTGVIDQGVPRGEFGLYGDLRNRAGPLIDLLGQGAFGAQTLQVYPDALEGPNPVPFQLKVHMREMPANIALTQAERDMDALPAVIEDVVSKKMQAFALHFALRLANSFVLSQNDSYVICALQNVSAAVADATNPNWFRFTGEPTNQTAGRLHRGDIVDFWPTGTLTAASIRSNDSQAAAANQTHATRLRVFVESSDSMSNIITFISEGDPGAIAWNGGAVGDGDQVTYQNVKLGATDTFTNIAGYKSWLKIGSGGVNNNIILGAEADATLQIDVTQKPEFKSYSKAINGPLTEHLLGQVLESWHNGKEELGQFIDMLLAPYGVWSVYRAQKIGQFRIDRTGNVQSVMNEGAVDGFKILINGRSYKGHSFSLLPVNTLIGLRMRDNWRMIVPPSGGGVREWEMNEPGVPFEFVGKGLGGSDILPIYDTSGGRNQVTSASQMPGRMRAQFMPDKQIAMLELTGVTQDNLFSDN